MIPISKDKVLKWVDPDDETEFEFYPLVGEVELEVLEASNSISVDPSPFLSDARQELENESALNSSAEEITQARVLNRAIKLASLEKGTGFDRKEADALYSCVNKVVKSCKPKNSNRVEFRGDATQHFDYVYNTKLFSAIMDANDLSEEERKN